MSRDNPLPMARPYPVRAIHGARQYLAGIRHSARTIECAEGFNTPLWQQTVAAHLTDEELREAEARGEAMRRANGWPPRN